MTIYTVVGVRKVLADDFSHRHIEGVCTDDGIHHTLRTVADSINAGDTWRTRASGYEETIRIVSGCPDPGCTYAPYLATKPRSPRRDNLERLDPC